MKIDKIIEAGIGLYLLAIGPEDIVAGGSTIIPSGALGVLLLAHAFGVKI